MLKEKYTHLSFPFDPEKPRNVLMAYITELNLGDVDTFEKIRVLFLHALRDYLDGKLDQRSYAALAFDIFTHSRAKEILKHQPGKLRSYLDDAVDIDWLSGSEHFEKYKEELKRFLEENVG